MANLKTYAGRLIGKGRAGRADPQTATLWTTPYAWRTDDGVYVGHNGEVWLYRSVPLFPMKWEDGEQQLAIASPLSRLLTDLGATSRQPVGGISTLANNRVIHIISITWQDRVVPPEANTPELRRYQSEAFGFLAPKRALLFGVQLRSSLRDKASKSDPGASQAKKVKAMAELVKQTIAEDVPDLDAYESDAATVRAIMTRHNAAVPTREQLDQLESWYNLGRGPDAVIEEQPTKLSLPGLGDLEMAAVMRFEQTTMPAPQATWAMDVISHPGDAPHVVSVRAELEPANLTRGRARKAQRRIISNAEEERKTGDLEKVELSSSYGQAKALEDYLAASHQPMLANCSIIMAREITEASETYLDFMSQAYGIQMKPLEHRQISALEETLPCSSVRTNPFIQDVNVPMIANAGLQAFSNIGDEAGAFGGIVDPDATPFFIDPLAAPRLNLPPSFAVFGDPGSGKTFFAQSLAVQAALNGLPVFLINPKGGDSLYGMVDYANSLGVPSARVSMSALEKEPGAFDPFRYAPPEIAAEIASTHILAALEDSLERKSPSATRELTAGLKRGALSGALCVWDALDRVPGEHKDWIKEQVRMQMEGSALFALGIALRPLPRLDVSQRLTLIDFDRELGLPEGKRPGEYNLTERIALAAVRLVTRAALEVLIAHQKGVLIVDEAWTYLSQPEGLASLQRISREGRSLNILPMFLTQRIADVVTRDLEGYLSRVLVLKLNERKEAEAALRLCGLRPTDQRLEELRACGPAPAADGKPAKWARGIFRDLYGRHSEVALGPTPAAAMQAFSTNPEDRRRRDAARRAREEELREEQNRAAARARQAQPAPQGFDAHDPLTSPPPPAAGAEPAATSLPWRQPQTTPTAAQAPPGQSAGDDAAAGDFFTGLDVGPRPRSG
ncbi:ATP-binding protein [Bailinhaonella thermotolerans]|uniref:AAA+ ATPase domain-containing protein n=1 Tax=Bailinhaonella thermotolerans TaxID=1070861 RepID=A0A3A4APE2_9ACTN|nr:ATP-binding protein [Bailinhaonella thermotolerans]RJL21209.1 hypothetical protein D5H75_37720 [Bailinhaonella thermotolerans]